ncbi:hypothetical protein, partial [Burkholderia cenocepacia]
PRMSSNSYVNLKIATCLVRYADDRLIDQRFLKQSVTISGIATGQFFQNTFNFSPSACAENSGFMLHQRICPYIAGSSIEMAVVYITKRMEIERLAWLDAPHRRHLLSVCRP